MPLPAYTLHTPGPKYQTASNLYDEAMAIADTDKTTAINKLKEVLSLLAICGETDVAELVLHKITKLGG